MNTFKKSETALYITLATFLLAVGAFTGDYLTYFKMLGVLFGFMGLAFSYYKLIVYILGKLYPENKTITKGATTTTVVNFKYE